MGTIREVRRGRLRFDVRDEGPRDGVPVVLLHGFPQDASSWDRVAPLLHAAGVRTIAPDQRGYSPDARPPHRGDYRLEWLVEDLRALLDTAGLPAAHVVGHDWGGAVAWAAGDVMPERVSSLTVLSTPHPRALIRSLVRSTQLLRSYYMVLFQVPRLPERALAPRLEGVLRGTGLPAADATRYAARMREPAALTGALHWYRALPLSRLANAPVAVPTTYVWGRADFALGRCAAELTEEEVAAPYRFVEVDAGHWLPETQAALVAEVVLDQVGDAR
ncbi:alpha/beta fold hydrolase [Georgenia sp. MJ206]|uniref:alpha/beta fold hydrolase n=1 Tax=Georgenia wangjunii TaxID=3117730 RepID=UPI002F2687CA